MTDPIGMSVTDAARTAGVSADSIRRAIKATEPPYLKAKRIGSRILIRPADLADWIDSLPDA